MEKSLSHVQLPETPLDCSPPGSSVHGILQARILLIGTYYLLQGIILAPGSNPCLLHCRQSLYHLCHQGATEGEMVGWHHRRNGQEFPKLQETVKHREAWRVAVHEVANESDTT